MMKVLHNLWVQKNSLTLRRLCPDFHNGGLQLYSRAQPPGVGQFFTPKGSGKFKKISVIQPEKIDVKSMKYVRLVPL